MTSRLNLIFLLVASILSILECFASPLSKKVVKPVENIGDRVFSLQDVELTSVQDLHIVLDRMLAPTTAQVAGIERSRLGYIQTSRAASGFIPPGRGITFSASLEGNVSMTGSLASDIEDATERIALGEPDRVREFYRTEKRNLQSRAGDNYFHFFQAARDFGFTEDQTTRDTLNSTDYAQFSEKVGVELGSSFLGSLNSRYSVTYSGVSDGNQRVIQAFAYVLINQITLSSGRILNIVQKNPELVVTDQEFNVIDRIENSVEFENIGNQILEP
ncbi:hypothetical protein BWQ96_09554 [Gracilariopsis chorda]|uniref:Uncharacterized protein n=1 Tax=Gracilariopsis chorda TaxID=448386 RepID=A0A2V3IF96_9FLOR|nr:hypothetical protein BWQ96_09554 [Gracilariopsis chorda]|eukprot:PXF40721.1 hypothetical protein BWQ96_09554 [Gracilariopsis chorda]